MSASPSTLSVNPLFLRHDLLIELGRVEMAIENAKSHTSANDHDIVTPLETQKARINEALVKLQV